MSDVSSKSAQYCASGMSGGTGLLLLVEAELGKPMYEIPTGDSGAGDEAKKKGCHSTLGVGRTCPQGWKDAKFINEDLKGVQVVSSQYASLVHADTTYCSRMSAKASATTRLRMPTDISASTSISRMTFSN